MNNANNTLIIKVRNTVGETVVQSSYAVKDYYKDLYQPSVTNLILFYQATIMRL